MDHSKFFDLDAGYYEYKPDLWMVGKFYEKQPWAKMSVKGIEAARKAEFRDSDILVPTVARSGQTWAMTIMHQILNVDALKKTEGAIASDIMNETPFLELEFADGETGTEKFAKLEHEPRIAKTHLRYDLLKENVEKHPNMKIIQVIRNPKDMLVSWFNQVRCDPTMGHFNGTWDDYFQFVKEKKLAWGDPFENTAGWYKFNKERKNSLILKYEEMKKDSKGYVIKIASFMGIKLSDEEVDLIVDRSSFKKMSTLLNPIIEKNFTGWRADRGSFVRKGQVGDWRNSFSPEQSMYIEKRCKEMFEPLGLSFEYE